MDCASGICVDGICLDSPPLGSSGSSDGGADSEALDAASQDGGDAVEDGGDTAGGSDTVTAPDTPGPDLPDQSETPCDERTAPGPGDACGTCDGGEFVCDEFDNLICVGDGNHNACGACGALEGQPGTPCGDCEGGQWTCGDDGQTHCQCPGQTRTGTCADPYELQPDEPLRVDLCGEGDDTNNVDGDGCSVPESRGPEVILQFSLENSQRVLIEARDDDDTNAVDTLLYLRSECVDPASQLACADDEPCTPENESLGQCVNSGGGGAGVQPRQSVLELNLAAGTYSLVVDSYEYTTGGGSFEFACGQVAVTLDLLPIEF